MVFLFLSYLLLTHEPLATYFPSTRISYTIVGIIHLL